MNSKTRRVAVVGGNRIPFARSNSVYSHASNQDMLTAALILPLYARAAAPMVPGASPAAIHPRRRR
jgi:acetyl-CoA C-acetyltransferase